MTQLNRVQQNYQKVQQHSRTAMIYGAGITATGAATLYSMKTSRRKQNVEIEQNRIGALGLGQKLRKKQSLMQKRWIHSVQVL